MQSGLPGLLGRRETASAEFERRIEHFDDLRKAVCGMANDLVGAIGRGRHRDGPAATPPGTAGTSTPSNGQAPPHTKVDTDRLNGYAVLTALDADARRRRQPTCGAAQSHE